MSKSYLSKFPPRPMSKVCSLTSKVQSLKSNSDGLRPAEFWALRDISFDLKRGECLGLIGRNGCGKTTLLRLIAGIFPPDQGEIAIRGRVGVLWVKQKTESRNWEIYSKVCGLWLSA